jgi:hypothetical protein
MHASARDTLAACLKPLPAGVCCFCRHGWTATTSCSAPNATYCARCTSPPAAIAAPPGRIYPIQHSPCIGSTQTCWPHQTGHTAVSTTLQSAPQAHTWSQVAKQQRTSSCGACRTAPLAPAADSAVLAGWICNRCRPSWAMQTGCLAWTG